MIPAPSLPDEARRLAALRALLLLDTAPEARFDRIVAFAASEFDVPIALLTLVDSDRLWLKSRVGLDVCEVERDASFCGHAIARSDLFVVEDATGDTRFSDNPMVTGEPHVRFYAGAPLVLPTGERLGTLCLIDTRPRQLDATDRAILGTLRELAVDELLREPTR